MQALEVLARGRVVGDRDEDVIGPVAEGGEDPRGETLPGHCGARRA